MKKTILGTILLSIIALLWVCVVLVVFFFVLLFFWPFDGNLLVYSIGIVFRLIEVSVLIFALTVIPLSLFVGWRSARRTLRHPIFLCFLLTVIVLFSWFFLLNHIAFISIPIPEDARSVRYSHGGGTLLQSGSFSVSFLWEVSDDEFIDFYSPLLEEKGFAVEVFYGQRNKNSPKYLSELKVTCLADKGIFPTVFYIGRGQSTKEDNPGISFINWNSHRCLYNLWF